MFDCEGVRQLDASWIQDGRSVGFAEKNMLVTEYTRILMSWRPWVNKTSRLAWDTTVRVKLGSTYDILSKIEARRLPSADARQKVYEALTQLNDDGVKALGSLLDGKKYKKTWIANSLTISDVDSDLANKLSNGAQVVQIDSIRLGQYKIPNVIKNEKPAVKPEAATPNQWGVETVGAPQIWKYYNGSGVVVASIDTGVLITHEAIKAKYR
ncbi:Suppressor of the cold-sensitive snRNP biogenesis mutant brr1-1 [Aphanomyces cochlioides]|nr:Suppressor of the cold-sensitive snRNP biogenesis mutant brr1-1 [Aphanomyces cochlioides]